MKQRRALGVTLTLLAALAIYAFLRVGQVLVSKEPDPSGALYDAHSGYFWRILIAAYGAGLLAPLLFWIAQRAPDVVAKHIPLTITIAAAVITLQGVFFP